MHNIPCWDEYFLNIADAVSLRSKDPNTKRGAVIVGPGKEIRSTGYNSFPRGINDNVAERLLRPTKYRFIEHAERNAIENAARCGTAIAGCTLYQQMTPCLNCALAILGAGISELVIDFDEWEIYKDRVHWKQDFDDVEQIFKEANFKMYKYSRKQGRRFI